MLPFLTPPATPTTRIIGTPASGTLELQVRGGLTVGESATINELLATEQNAFVRGAQLADILAKEESISLTEAFRLIEDAIAGRTMEPEADAIRLRHAERISEIARVYARAGQRNIEATVTALIRSRCGLPDWSMDDTQGLHKALLDGIWQLAQDEQLAEAMPVNPPSEEELGKPQPAKTTGKPSTGKKSSGN